MYSCAGHVTMVTVFGQTLALQLGNGDEPHALESDMTGLNVKGENLYLYCSIMNALSYVADFEALFWFWANAGVYSLDLGKIPGQIALKKA